jgi:hypothetical protein
MNEEITDEKAFSLQKATELFDKYDRTIQETFLEFRRTYLPIIGSPLKRGVEHRINDENQFELVLAIRVTEQCIKKIYAAEHATGVMPTYANEFRGSSEYRFLAEMLLRLSFKIFNISENV